MGDKARDEPRSRSWRHVWEHRNAREVSSRRETVMTVLVSTLLQEKGRKMQKQKYMSGTRAGHPGLLTQPCLLSYPFHSTKLVSILLVTRHS